MGGWGMYFLLMGSCQRSQEGWIRWQGFSGGTTVAKPPVAKRQWQTTVVHRSLI